MLSETEAVLHAHLTAAEDDRDRYRRALEQIASLRFSSSFRDIERVWDIAVQALALSQEQN